MDQEKIISFSSVKMNLGTYPDKCTEPNEPNSIQSTPEEKVFHDMNNSLRSSEVACDIITNGRSADHRQILTNNMSEGLNIIHPDKRECSTRYLPKGTEFGSYDHLKTCCINDSDSISRDTWKIESSDILTKSEEKHEKENNVYDSSQHPQFDSQLNFIKEEKDEMKSLMHFDIVCDIKVKPELEPEYNSYTSHVDETNPNIDQKMADLKPISMEQKQKITSSMKMNLPDKCAEPYEPNHQSASDMPDHMHEGLSITQNDTGVWSTRFLPKGTKFGPYEHSAVSSDSLADGLDWTSSLRKSSVDNEHNIEAAQFGSMTVYNIVTDIQPKTELISQDLKPTSKIDETNTDSDIPYQVLDTSVTNKQETFRCIDYGTQNHMLTHSGEKPHECKQCGKSFSGLEHLKQHLKSHTGVKSHQCGKCGKLLSHGSSMKRHMLTHTREKAFQCIECGKEFIRKCHLSSHMLIHSGEKPHECNQCGKFFSQSGNLKRHMTTHTGAKSHKCSECGKLFSQHDGMKQHMLIHTGEKPHECKQCGKFFSQSGNLGTHMKSHMGVNSHK